MTGDADNEQLRELVAAASTHQPAPVAAGTIVPMIAMRIGARWFGVDAERVREVVTLEAITAVPGAVQWVLGVALVRGRLVPVLDLPTMLGTARGGDVAITRPRLAVFTHGDSEAAVIADETRGVLELPPASPNASRFVRGELRWNGSLMAVLDAAAIVDVVSGGDPPR
jgi:chemotaxis signal transduction protein